MIHNRQKMLIHIYKEAAELTEAYYRELLVRHAGYRSAAAKSFPQHGFDLVMAALETVLFDRVDQGIVPDPIGSNRHIRSRDYWRGRLVQTGMINTRQLHQITALWNQLAPMIGFADPNAPNAMHYIMRIVCRSIGREIVGLESLSLSEASNLIDALKDRLSYAYLQESAIA